MFKWQINWRICRFWYFSLVQSSEYPDSPGSPDSNLIKCRTLTVIIVFVCVFNSVSTFYIEPRYVFSQILLCTSMVNGNKTTTRLLLLPILLWQCVEVCDIRGAICISNTITNFQSVTVWRSLLMLYFLQWPAPISFPLLAKKGTLHKFICEGSPSPKYQITESVKSKFSI